MEKLLALQSLSKRVLLVFWLVVLCIPLVFLRYSLISLIQEDERRLSEQARRDLREEMGAFVEDLHLSHQIHKAIRGIENQASQVLSLRATGGRVSPNEPEDFLLSGIRRELGVKPLFLLVDVGPELPPRVWYNSALFSPFSAPSRRLAELWLRSLKQTPTVEELQRLTRIVHTFLGEYVSPILNPDQIQETFSIRLGRERLLIASGPQTKDDKSPIRAWIAVFLDRDFSLQSVLKRACSKPFKQHCSRMIRSCTDKRVGAFFETASNRMTYSVSMPRLLYCQGGVIPSRATKGLDTRNRQTPPLLTVSISGNELQAGIRPIQSLIDPLLAIFLGTTLLWVFCPEWRPQLALSLTTRLYAAMLGFAILPLSAFGVSVLSYRSLDQTLDTSRKLEVINQRLEMLDSGLSAFATIQQTVIRGFKKEMELMSDMPEAAIEKALQRLKDLPYVRWVFFLRSDGFELRKFFMDGAPQLERQFQEEALAAMSGGMRTYLQNRKVFDETYVYPAGTKPPRKSLISPSTDFGSPEIVELRQGSFMRSIFPNQEEVFVTFLVLSASSSPKLPRATCGLLIDPAIILQQYLKELRATPDFFHQQDPDFKTEFRLFRFDPLKKLLIRDPAFPVSESDEEFELFGQLAIKSAQGATLNLLNSTQPRLVQSRKFHGFPAVGVAIARPSQGKESRFSFFAFVTTLVFYSILVVLLLGRFLKEILVEPFLQFREGVGRIGAGDYGTALTLQTGDEFQDLGMAFNELSQELAGKERMKRFLSDRIVRAVELEESAPPQQTQQAAILVSDIRGFTGLSETHDAEQITTMLNSYFTLMEESIQDEGGFIDKFIGDCLVAVFFPVEGADSSDQRALKAALKMRHRLHGFNLERREMGLFVIDNGIGISSGAIISGLIKSGFKRRELGIFGDAIQEAYRLESRARDAHRSGIVVSDRIKAALTPEWDFNSMPGEDSTDWELDVAIETAGVDEK